MSERPTYRDIAHAASVSVGTVSLALRGDPRITEATRQRVAAAAEALGYRPNAHVNELMEAVRHRRSVDRLKADFAVCWFDALERLVRAKPHLMLFQKALANRFREFGYGLDAFYLGASVEGRADPTLDLPRVLQARGIRGLVLAPLLYAASASPGWDYSALSVTEAGTARWRPVFDRVGFDHFRKVYQLRRELEAMGYDRVGFVYDAQLDARTGHRQLGAFWADVPKAWRRRDCVYAAHPGNHSRARSALYAWVDRFKPEALLFSDFRAADYLGERGWSGAAAFTADFRPDRLRTVLRYQDDYALLGRTTATRLLELVRGNEIGPPEKPSQTLIEGRMVVEAETGARLP